MSRSEALAQSAHLDDADDLDRAPRAAVAPAALALDSVEPADWPGVAARFADRNYRQTAAFDAACAARVGAASERVVVRRAGELLAAACVRVKRVPLLGGVAYVAGGPLVGPRDNGASARFGAAVDALVAEYSRRRRLVLRVAPPLGEAEWHASVEKTLAQRGFRVAPDAPRYRTFVVDLSPPVETIRQRLRQKWRNGLNRAEKNVIDVSVGHGAEDFAAFGELFDELRQRKPFHVELDAAFYARVQQQLAADERLLVLLARVEGQLAAGMVVSLLGETAVYLLGASNDLGMQSKASYLLQWRTILVARDRGCVRYDLGGIDPAGNPGVHHFKEGLGGQDVTVPGPFDYVAPGLRGTLSAAGLRGYAALRSAWRRRRSRAEHPAGGPGA